MFRRLAVLIANAAAMGTDMVTLCTGSRDGQDQWRHHPDNASPAAWADLQEEMAKAADLAEAHGVRLGIEPELANVVHDAAKARLLLDTLQSPALVIVLDPANLFETCTLAQQHRIFNHSVELLADRIAMAHAKDCAADGSFVVSGQGVIDSDYFLGRLRDADFDGDLVILPRTRLMRDFSMWSANLISGDRSCPDFPLADFRHFGVTDEQFAPSLLFFPDLVAPMRGLTAIGIHIHLMCADFILLAQIEQFADAGADLISIHVENAAVAGQALDLIAAPGLAADMAGRVETPVAQAVDWLDRLDFLTLLGAAIDVKGQGLDPTAPDRLQAAGRLIAACGRRIVLAADGGIRADTMPLLRAAGAEKVVSGSLAFGASDLDAQMRWLHGL